MQKHVYATHAGQIAESLRLIYFDVAKENMIGVMYEILPLAVINSVQIYGAWLTWSLG